MVKVSVILTAFNEERFIENAIDSVLNQTLKDFEIIVVNDGSTDNTLNIIENFNDSRLKLINQENVCYRHFHLLCKQNVPRYSFSKEGSSYTI